MATPRILDYSDYREYLRDCLEGLRETRPWFSLRHLARQLALDAGNLVKVTQKERHLPTRCLATLSLELGLNEREREYLERLVVFGKAKSQERTRAAYERLLELKYVRPEVLGRSQYAFYRDWRCTAVLALLHVENFQTTEAQIARHLEPASSVEDIHRVLSLLEELGLAKRARGGRWQACKSVLTTGEAWRDLAIRAFQKETMRLAERALNEIPREERDISTLTVTLGSKDLEKVREISREFRAAILALASETPAPQRVWQLNLQLFPLSRPVEAKA